MTKQIMVGNVQVGGREPVYSQSKRNTPTHDVNKTVKHIHHLQRAGCQIIRVAVPDMPAAHAIGKITAQYHIPLVVDIHFD